MIIDVKTKNESYNIIIERNAVLHLEDYIDLKRKVLIITDSGVPKQYYEPICNVSQEGYIYIIPNGENSKNIDNFQKILTFMIANNFTRTDCVIAVGGGVVGDLSGFVSSCYMRGIDFYNVPTTLLSQIDSSIGGKTAINYGGIKNIVGSFYQPRKVVIDANTLNTLSERQLHAGLIEAIKMASTCNHKLFELIENTTNLKEDIDEIIYQALMIKKQIVEDDPLEKSIRKILNFGHTFGHAIEVLSKGQLLHGEAVGIGMLYFASLEAKERITKVLQKYSLPITTEYKKEEMIELIKHDKKTSGNMISYIYVDNIGECKIIKESIDKILVS